MELICVLKITLNAMAELEENNDACVYAYDLLNAKAYN